MVCVSKSTSDHLKARSSETRSPVAMATKYSGERRFGKFFQQCGYFVCGEHVRRLASLCRLPDERNRIAVGQFPSSRVSENSGHNVPRFALLEFSRGNVASHDSTATGLTADSLWFPCWHNPRFQVRTIYALSAVCFAWEFVVGSGSQVR